MSHYDEEWRDLTYKHAQEDRVESFLDKQAAKEKEADRIQSIINRTLWPEEEKIDDDVSIGEPCKELDEAVDKAVAYKDMMELREEVKDPIHYQAFGTDVMEVISRSMTEEAFRGFCLGNWLKYKLRAGNKGSADKDIAKSENYKVMFEEYKDYCIPTQPF